MEQYDLLYLFEYYKITKVGGANSPCVWAEWPGIQIPQSILSLLDRKGLQFTFFNEKRVGEDYTLLFHERNQAGRGLDFDDFSKAKIRLRQVRSGTAMPKPSVGHQEDTAPAPRGPRGGGYSSTADRSTSQQRAKEGARKNSIGGGSHKGMVPGAPETMQPGYVDQLTPRSRRSDDTRKDPRPKRSKNCDNFIQDSKGSSCSDTKTDV